MFAIHYRDQEIIYTTKTIPLRPENYFQDYLHLLSSQDGECFGLTGPLATGGGGSTRLPQPQACLQSGRSCPAAKLSI